MGREGVRRNRRFAPGEGDQVQQKPQGGYQVQQKVFPRGRVSSATKGFGWVVLLINLVIHSVIPSFFIHSFIYLFIRLFTYSFINSFFNHYLFFFLSFIILSFVFVNLSVMGMKFFSSLRLMDNKFAVINQALITFSCILAGSSSNISRLSMR